ncbi:hypothetical protein [Cohnella lubricantis]|uniref:Uncharacterized protein n=1 Tax=Cohnella lubricantis TaxID=2163172 RepID=A0A841T6E8_9BACL|nr:hypothetical protein [Cohnella lubricantis]MBB6676904.1 hypothetical protein [Cohnella lubricantis]MBP2118305.1 hypothetical protein [Cohnella lubricantis]
MQLEDVGSGIDHTRTILTLDGTSLELGAAIPLYALPLGSHTLIVTTSDMAGNTSSRTILFETQTGIPSLKALIDRFRNAGWIDNNGIANSLRSKLKANQLAAFVHEVEAQRGKHIADQAADYLLRDAEFLLSN